MRKVHGQVFNLSTCACLIALSAWVDLFGFCTRKRTNGVERSSEFLKTNQLIFYLLSG